MHLYRIIVPVSDIARAEAFYRTVLRQDGKRVSPGRHYFDCEGTILACYDSQADGDHTLPDHLYFAVNDLEETYAHCQQAGAAFSHASIPDVGPLGAIATRPWGERSFYTTDPFGNKLCFVDKTTTFTG